jgi:hypothetical protein
MIGALSLFDRVNFIKPPGPGLDPTDDPTIIANLAKLSAHGQQDAFAFLVADPAETGTTGAARSDYFRYLAVAGVLGLAVGAGAVFLLKR